MSLTRSIIGFTVLMAFLSALHGAEIPKLEKRDWIDPKVAAALTNRTEILLHAIRLPEVQFAQAGLEDIVEFLNYSIKKQAKSDEAKGIRISLGPNFAFGPGEADVITLGAKDISVLEVLKYLRRAGNLDRQIEGRQVTLVRKKATQASQASASSPKDAGIGGQNLFLYRLNHRFQLSTIARMKSHEDIDQRSLTLARAIVARIDADSRRDGLSKARVTCTRWLNNHPTMVLREWQALLSNDWPIIRAVLLDPGDEGRRLRQSSPFCGILSPQERWKIYQQFHHEPQAA